MFCGEIISNLDELEVYKTEWNQLLLQSNKSFFLSWEWVSTWWEFFGKNSLLFVIVVKDANGQLVGVAPLKIAPRKIFGVVPVRMVEFIGYGSPVSPEYLDFIVSGQNREEIVAEIVSALIENKRSWDILVLSDVDENSPVLPLLRRRLSEKNVIVWQRAFNVCPYLKLPSTWNELLNSYSHSMRGSIRATRRKLESSCAVRFTLVEDITYLPQAFERAACLHYLSRQKRGERGSFSKEDYLAFHLKLSQIIAHKGWLYLAFLAIDERPVAFRYGFLYEQKYYDYQTGYDPQFERYRVGWATLGYIMEDLITRSVGEYDFLRGGHEYKWRWAKEFRRTLLFCSFQHNPASLSLYAWWRVKEGIKRLLFPCKAEVPYEKDQGIVCYR
jgi:CelD/BcsL family acetyltransferase involved in cellulose biosynthesis